jgi:hypothetical protein
LAHALYLNSKAIPWKLILPMDTTTVFDACSAYSAIPENKTRVPVLMSTIGRYLVECWGGQAPKGSRTTPREQIIIEEFLKTLPVAVLFKSVEVLEKAFEEKKISKDNIKSYRYAYKSFIDWLKVNNYDDLKNELIEKATVTETKSILFNRNSKGSGRKNKRSHHGLSCKKPYALMSKYSGSSGKKCGQLIYPEDYINEYLFNQMDMFAKFRHQNHNCSKATIAKDISHIYRILGWLHRYKNITLHELSLESIIHFIKLNIPTSEAINLKGKINYHQHIFKKAIARQEAIDLANQDKKFIQEYLDFVGGHSSSKVFIIHVCIAVAKFLFRNELGTDDYIDEIDLPIVRRLNQLSNLFNEKLKSEPHRVPYELKSVSWQEAISVLENYRERANATKSDLNHIREKSGIMNDLQNFLILAFMLLIPVDRARTYYELEIDKTFVYGINEGGRFTPATKIKDKNTAKWYIHLMPEDYKTGKIYKEYWGIMPNVEFSDGTKLYQYIDRWIKEGREYKQKCNHNFFFRKVQKYEKFHPKTLTCCIKNMFVSVTEVPVTPKELRKMYVTYLNNKGATNAELKAAAKAMHHSPQMQEKIYNSQTILDSIAPIYALNERMHEEFFGNSESD